jgi:hypothetical protein
MVALDAVRAGVLYVGQCGCHLSKKKTIFYYLGKKNIPLEYSHHFFGVK